MPHRPREVAQSAAPEYLVNQVRKLQEWGLVDATVDVSSLIVKDADRAIAQARLKPEEFMSRFPAGCRLKFPFSEDVFILSHSINDCYGRLHMVYFHKEDGSLKWKAPLSLLEAERVVEDPVSEQRNVTKQRIAEIEDGE
jgi:hypothetical protein